MEQATQTATTTTAERVWVQGEVDTPVRDVIDRLASGEKRSRAKQIEVLLETHPRVKKLLETAGAGA